MNLLRIIPNLFTLANLFCGILAVNYVVLNNFEKAALFVVIAIGFDFFDGFLARIFGVQGDFGKQLDSLADMVTSGVVPGLVMYYLLYLNILPTLSDEDVTVSLGRIEYDAGFLPYVGLLLSLGACYRLATFNLDTHQSKSFSGLPTPAMCLFVISLPLIQIYSHNETVLSLLKNNYFLIGVTLVFSLLMNIPLKLMALKFSNFSIRDNFMKYLLILSSVVLLIWLRYTAIPIIIVLYIGLSLFAKND
ncbi:MAG: phosphatidylserine synthase [Flavobacteriaceae bacterium]|nr:phosphatidylserine synthase [Flavobacteriaceae bacterium]|tara:strand:+ start:197400 stop:198143 length:744 start_codon:yes stop_codon:yes gene_type:complete